MTAGYSRALPSARYRELLAQYKLMHTHGEQHQQLPPEQTFAGQSLPRHSQAIKRLIDQYQAATLLDYGAGKGQQYMPRKIESPDGQRFESIPEYWGVESITCFDPAYVPFSALPTGKFDGVVCTDVLEHCPEFDVPWIVDEIFSFARQFVYANVACYPARKRLANGENAHCTIKSTPWWQAVIQDAAARHPRVRAYFQLDHLVADSAQPRIEPVLLQV